MSASNPARRSVFRGNRLADYAMIIGVFSIALLYSLRRMSDSDLWGHLKCGEYFFRTGSILKTYYFNCSWPDFPYLNHEWLFQAIIYKVYEFAGEYGLMALQAVLVLASFAVLYRILKLYTGSLPFVGFILLLGVVASSHRFALRPQHFSYLFLLYFLFALHMFQRGRKGYLYLMPPVMLLWVNIHAESIWGVLVPGLFALIEGIKTFAGRGMDKKDLQKAALVFCGILAASMINPYTYKTVVWPLYVMKEQFAGVEELLSPTGGRYLFFWIYFGLFVITSALNIRRIDPTWAAISLIYAVIAWTANRGIPHFVFVSAPVIAANLDSLFAKMSPGERASRLLSVSGRTALLSLIVVFMVSIVRSPLYLRKFDNIPYPEGAVGFMKANNISGNVFNHHPWGCYLIWTSYPSLRPYIDGRFFQKKFYDEFRRIAFVGQDWQSLLAKYDITIALLPYSVSEGGTINDRLFAVPGWRLVYWDDVSLLYLKDVAANGDAIKKYGTGAINPDRQLYDYNETSPESVRAANAAAERNLKWAGDSYRALIVSANTFFLMGDYLPAAKRYESALKLMYGGGNAWMFYRLALCRRHVGDLQGAAGYLRRCLSLAPEFEDARRMLGELRLLQGGG